MTLLSLKDAKKLLQNEISILNKDINKKNKISEDILNCKKQHVSKLIRIYHKDGVIYKKNLSYSIENFYDDLFPIVKTFFKDTEYVYPSKHKNINSLLVTLNDVIHFSLKNISEIEKVIIKEKEFFINIDDRALFLAKELIHNLNATEIEVSECKNYGVIKRALNKRNKKLFEFGQEFYSLTDINAFTLILESNKKQNNIERLEKNIKHAKEKLYDAIILKNFIWFVYGFNFKYIDIENNFNYQNESLKLFNYLFHKKNFRMYCVKLFQKYSKNQCSYIFKDFSSIIDSCDDLLYKINLDINVLNEFKIEKSKKLNILLDIDDNEEVIVNTSLSYDLLMKSLNEYMDNKIEVTIRYKNQAIKT